jgi:hypothetical protein
MKSTFILSFLSVAQHWFALSLRRLRVAAHTF